jgi:hypothetical protein
MAHTDEPSIHADPLARLGDDGTKELFRRLLEKAIQELIDAELTAQIGAIDRDGGSSLGSRPPAPSHQTTPGLSLAFQADRGVGSSRGDWVTAHRAVNPLRASPKRWEITIRDVCVY